VKEKETDRWVGGQVCCCTQSTCLHYIYIYMYMRACVSCACACACACACVLCVGVCRVCVRVCRLCGMTCSSRLCNSLVFFRFFPQPMVNFFRIWYWENLFFFPSPPPPFLFLGLQVMAHSSQGGTIRATEAAEALEFVAASRQDRDTWVTGTSTIKG